MNTLAVIISCIINVLTGIWYTAEQIIKFISHPFETLHKL
jgi:phage-related protein